MSKKVVEWKLASAAKMLQDGTISHAEIRSALGIGQSVLQRVRKSLEAKESPAPT